MKSGTKPVEYYHFTPPKQWLDARKNWQHRGRVSSLEKALAMAAFGQMMKTGMSISGWWGTEPNHINEHRFFFSGHRHTSDGDLLVTATPTLLQLEHDYKQLQLPDAANIG